jgi:hypothetical protein
MWHRRCKGRVGGEEVIELSDQRIRRLLGIGSGCKQKKYQQKILHTVVLGLSSLGAPASSFTSHSV